MKRYHFNPLSSKAFAACPMIQCRYRHAKRTHNYKQITFLTSPNLSKGINHNVADKNHDEHVFCFVHAGETGWKPSLTKRFVAVF